MGAGPGDGESSAARPAAATPGVRRRSSVALAATALVLALFFSPALLGQGQFLYRDAGRMHHPVKRLVAAEWSQGRLPEWNPYEGLGVPLVGGGVDAVQHPFNLLLVALPFEAGFKAWVLLSYLLAAAGGFWWVREMGASRTAAALGGLAFALSGPMVSSSDNLTYLAAYAALPAVLAAGARWLRRPGPASLSGVAAAAALCAAAGDPLAWAIATAALVLEGLLLGAPGRRWLGGVAAASSLAAAAPFVLPVWAWSGESFRAGGLPPAELVRWNLHPWRLAELALPGLFRGDPADLTSGPFQAFAGNESTAIPWFLSVYLGAGVLVLAAAARGRVAGWLIAAAAALTWAALGPHAGFGQIARALPGLGALRYWEKLAVWPALLLGAAAALALDRLAAEASRLRRAARVAAGVGAVAVAASLAARVAPAALAARLGHPRDAALALVANGGESLGHVGGVALALGAAAWLASRGRLRGRGPALVAAVAVADLAAANAGAYRLLRPSGEPPLARAIAAGPSARVVTPFRIREDRWPELGRDGSSWRWGERTLAPAWNVAVRVGNLVPYVGLREARLARYDAEARLSDRAAQAGVWGVGWLVVPSSPELARLAGAAGARPVAADDELPAWLVEIPHRPRAYLAREPFSCDAEGALAFVLAGAPGGRTAVEGAIPGGGASGDVRVVRDEPSDVALDVAASAPGVLVLNDAWAPGWSATVDGAPASILRANWLARAVAVPEGRHRVAFRYRTPLLREGWALAGALGLGLLAWAARRAARPRPAAR